MAMICSLCLALASAGATASGLLPERFSDTNLYDIVEMGGGYDVALSANRPHSVNAQRGTNVTFLATVPCREYVRAWVLCDVSADPKRDPAFTLRFTRYVSGPVSAYLGRSYDSLADTLVDLKGRTGRQLVEVDPGIGEIVDIVRTDRRGDYVQLAAELKAKGLTRYLDFELLGRTYRGRNGFGDVRMDVNPSHVSGVKVLAVALEKPSAELEPEWIEPGNIFHNDEKPETFMLVDVKRPGNHRLRWTVKDDEGRRVSVHEKPIAGTEKVRVDLAQTENGWYELVWELFDGERLLLTHHASFALLGRDTRKAGKGEPPYGTGSLFNWHYRLDNKTQQEVGAKLLYKAGMRRASRIDTHAPIAPDLKEKYLLAGSGAGEFRGGETPEQIRKTIDERLAASPTAKNVMVLYESSRSPYRHAEEVTGGTHDPAKGIPGASNRVEGAKRVCAFIRREYPDVKITVGNSLVCSELVAELMRAGFPKENADYMGSESVVRTTLPERMSASSIQAVDCYRELARHYGYPWGVNSCMEHCYRLDAVLGADYQAWWYVRDLVLMQCWRFPDIFIADVVSAGNHYDNSFWGGSGTVRRTPYLYPKKAYVGLATATKVLDQVVSRRHVPTGDDSVRVVEFMRRDGTCAYALWAIHGEADIEFDVSGRFEVVDFYGRIRKARSASFWSILPGRGSYRLRIGERMSYLTAGRPVVTAVRCVGRDYERAYRQAHPTDAKILADTTDSTRWEIAKDVLPQVECARGRFPARQLGKGAMKAVVDGEKGPVIELTLSDPDLSLPQLVGEYAFLRLKEPVKLDSLPNSLGVWIKGNAGLGDVFFVLEDRFRRLHVSSGGGNETHDYEGLQQVNFSGWKLLNVPVTQKSSVVACDGADLIWTMGNRPTWDYRLVGLVFAAHSRPLFLDEHHLKDQTIRIGPIVGFDYR